MAINVATPPEVGEEDGKPVLFIAGPIQGGPVWQSEAIDMIESMTDDLILANPRGDYSEIEFDYDQQVEWEVEYMDRAARLGGALFWLAAQVEQGELDDRGFYRAYAQTSRGELFEYKMRHQLEGAKMVIGIEPGFGNERYIRKRFGKDCPGVHILDNLADTCLRAVEIILETTEQD